MRNETLKVFITARESTCDECRENLGAHAWITLAGDKGALCLTCADLDHLVFLPRGEAALTRRAWKHSTLSAVVLKWSRARKRYERQGVLVEARGLERAEEECLADSAIRERRRERESARRAILDREYLDRFAARVRELYPGCPPVREREIAEHACRKHSGRVGRSAAAKELEETALSRAVTAHVRHQETNYDELLALGYDRLEARRAVQADTDRVLEAWQNPR